MRFTAKPEDIQNALQLTNYTSLLNVIPQHFFVHLLTTLHNKKYRNIVDFMSFMEEITTSGK